LENHEEFRSGYATSWPGFRHGISSECVTVTRLHLAKNIIIIIIMSVSSLNAAAEMLL
jgi:hypothetical protein